MSTPLLRGFPPVVDERARTLILGSFPSAQSLLTGQYYANPRNAFWSITGELFGFDAAAPYPRRLAQLRRHRIALWDVLHACRRAGSADSAIEPNSLVVNGFGEFFAEPPGSPGCTSTGPRPPSCTVGWPWHPITFAFSGCRRPVRRT
ncbi:hypothetical protein D522_14465 [Mycobacterium avium subsp. paratuberculosis S5]|nr:hypothetical protein D522_14465 [Mycobacterium avium subsp. paratuberculosis S5]